MDYKSAGVNIDVGNDAVNRIKPLVKQTFTPNVLNTLGGFAGMYEIPQGYKNPVLVSCTDGVGTKLKLAIEAQKFDTLGIDLVAMCVNDLICCGATPLYFLDYIACHELNPDQIEAIIKGMSNACIESRSALIGGEMAEMNDLYKPNDFDVAGFSVGIVEKSEIIDGQTIKEGNYVYACPSAGFHSNGYSLIRKVLTKEVREQHNISIEELLTPTKLYVETFLKLKEQGAKLTGLSHITGGGLAENVERVLPEGIGFTVNKSDIKTLPCFKQLQEIGNISEDEMYRVFNMGVGLIIISEEPLPESEDYYLLSRIENTNSGVTVV